MALANLLGEHAQDVELMMAGAVLTVLPVVVLFALFQRQYLEGIAEREPARVKRRARSGSRSPRSRSPPRRRERPEKPETPQRAPRAGARQAAPPGAYPRWAGAASSSTGRWSARRTASTRALLSEDGALEVEKEAFSIEPFLWIEPDSLRHLARRDA